MKLNLKILLNPVLLTSILFSCLSDGSVPEAMIAEKDVATGQYLIKEGDDIVLQYNYQTVHEEDVVRLESAKAENFTRRQRDTFVTSSIYAVPRSDYIHPIYGLQGEMLTRDWPDGGHPHHRGVFWAWPEVYYGSRLGDIYALQTVFARPTGEIELLNGPDFAQITAVNTWMWEDREAIVKEKAVIRVYSATDHERMIDLALRFTALVDSVTIATRETNSYGGLNLRMQSPENQKITYYSDDVSAQNRKAWSEFSGTFDGAESASGMTVLQHPSNPEYPGQWVEYPDLSWVQPTFPSPGTRYALKKGIPLELHYRLILHRGGEQEKNVYETWWDHYKDDISVMNLLKNQ